MASRNNRICDQGTNSAATRPSSGVLVSPQTQADVMPGRGRAVLLGAGDRDLELPGQERELRVQGAPLPQELAVRPGIDHLVGGDAGPGVARDVADAVAAGLDPVQVGLRQHIHHVGGGGQGDPVELQVVASREVPEASPFAGLADITMVEFPGHPRQRTQLEGRQLAIRHGDAQHRGVPLDVPAVLQPPGLECIVRQFARQVARELVAELRCTGTQERAVEVGVAVHAAAL